MLENPLFVMIVISVLVSAIVTLLVFLKKSIKNDYIKATNELVEEGEITKEQGDAIIWLLFEYKPNKRKRNESLHGISNRGKP